MNPKFIGVINCLQLHTLAIPAEAIQPYLVTLRLEHALTCPRNHIREYKNESANTKGKTMISI